MWFYNSVRESPDALAWVAHKFWTLKGWEYYKYRCDDCEVIEIEIRW